MNSIPLITLTVAGMMFLVPFTDAELFDSRAHAQLQENPDISSAVPTRTDSIKTTNDLRITNYCQLYSFFEKGEFPNGDKLYLLSYDEVSEKYPDYMIDKTHYQEFLDATKRFGYPYFERWHPDKYDGPTKNIDWMYMKEWQIHPEMFNLFERFMHKSDSRPSCITPGETYMISHIPYNSICAPGFALDDYTCSIDYRCGYPYPGNMCSREDNVNPKYLKPLKQEHVGIKKSDTICIAGKMLAFRTSDDSAVCVNPDSIPKMVQRGTIHMSDFKNILVQASSLLEITIEEPIENRGLAPILIKQITDNTQFYFDNIILWDFLTEDYGDWEPRDTRISWDRLSGNYGFDYGDIKDTMGENPVDWTRMSEEGFTVPSLLYVTKIICGPDEYSAVIHYGYPITIPLKDNTAAIISSSYAGGLLPDKEGIYRLNIGSYFEQTVQLPEKAVEMSHSYEQCTIENLDFRKIDFHNNFVKAYHSEIVFKMEN